MDTASANTAYLYRVRVAAPVTTAFSPLDLATTVIFTDPVLSTAVAVKAVHVNEMRTAVNAVRVLSGTPPFAFADPTLTPGTTVIKAIHMNELRGIINAARSSLGLAAITYTNPSIVAPTSVISAADINDLRNGVK